MRIRTVVVAAAAALGLWACSDGPMLPPGTTKCNTQGECPVGLFCKSGGCLEFGAFGAALGQACGSDGNCGAGLSCASGAYTGGLCTVACNGPSCPTGSICTDARTSGGGFVCAKQCAAPADCRPGYTCCAGFGNACVPSALCPAKNPPVSADLGQPCASTACASGEICAPRGPEFPGPTCTLACNAADQSTCPSGSQCVSTSTGAFCFATCAPPGGCTSPMACLNGLCRAPSPPPACTPGGPVPQAIDGGLLPPAGDPGCRTTVQLSPLATLRDPAAPVGKEITVDVPPGTGSLSILSQGVTVPVSSVTVNGSVPNSVVPTLLKEPPPPGSVIFDDLPPPPAEPSLLRVFYGGLSPFTGMMTVPNTAQFVTQAALQGGLTPGPWKFTVNDFAQECPQVRGCSCAGGCAPSTYDIQVVLKPGVAPATGTVDIAFYLVGTNLTAATAGTNPAVQRMLQTLSTLYAGAGLCIGKITFYDLPTWARTKYATSINPNDDSICGLLSQMFTLSAPGNQLNLFLIDAFNIPGSTGPSPVGVDGTIPGPSTVNGTISSGAAVVAAGLRGPNPLLGCDPTTSNPLSCGPDEVAYIAAHEGGHWMGLYHTTEKYGDSFDPLTDTPTCVCTQCAAQSERAACVQNKPPAGTQPTKIFNSRCLPGPSTAPTCGGGDNLMFWLLGTGAKGLLTPQQGQVIRANPVVR